MGSYEFAHMMLQTSKLKHTIIRFIHDQSCLILMYAVKTAWGEGRYNKLHFMHCYNTM